MSSKSISPSRTPSHRRNAFFTPTRQTASSPQIILLPTNLVPFPNTQRLHVSASKSPLPEHPTPVTQNEPNPIFGHQSALTI